MSASDSPEKVLATSKEAVEDADIAEEDKVVILAAAADTDASDSTLRSYIRQCKVLAETADKPLTEHTAADIDSHIDALGTQREWSRSTFKNYQCAALMLGEHLCLETDDISRTKQQSGSQAIDQHTVLTQADFHDIREAATRIRDKALIDFLGYTGQRVRVAQLLRIKDVDLKAGVWHMPDGSGLKGADESMSKRPLLAAEQSMSQLLTQHPTGDRDDHIFTTMSMNGTKPGNMIQQKSMRRAINKCADEAGVTDKPTNPHAFRHHFVTVAKQRYEMEDSVIKRILGHSPDSTVMETTYAHVEDDKIIQQAREAMGLPDNEDTDDLAPPVCEACQRPLRPTAEQCPDPSCGEWVTEPATTPEDELRQMVKKRQELDEKIDKLADSLGIE